MPQEGLKKPLLPLPGNSWAYVCCLHCLLGPSRFTKGRGCRCRMPCHTRGETAPCCWHSGYYCRRRSAAAPRAAALVLPVAGAMESRAGLPQQLPLALHILFHELLDLVPLLLVQELRGSVWEGVDELNDGVNESRRLECCQHQMARAARLGGGD